VLRYNRALVAAARGDDTTARELADAITGWAEPRGARLIAQFADHARGLAALGRCDFEAAYRHASAIGTPGEFARYNHHALWVCMDLVEAAVRTGRPAEAAAHVGAMRRDGIARISPRIALLAAGSAGLAARGDDAALAEYARALAIAGVERWPFDLARVRLAYGERLRRARAGRAAATELTAARDAFERLGAVPWARRAAAEIRATGHAARPPTVTGLEEPLTPQEHEIASLAAAGLTNKQIGARLYLSHRTVSGHLYRIFPKLGISTRAALRDALPSDLARDAAARDHP
jgi:DNA-binding CsgD family transcriptional regulator